ncbi:MAG TPA: hypothetical protein VG146_20295 [Verrucomicrobiae bacterium]|nr:hypothetical protein [Verrucomicrobiae bacterium]
MNTATETIQHQSMRESAFKLAAGGSLVEAIGALATIALAIVGLAGVFSPTMAAIATIVIGASILIEGGSFGAVTTRESASVTERTEWSGGMSAGFLGGLTGIVLGILALLGVAQMTLLSVAILTFGASFFLGSMSFMSVMPATVGGQVLVGLAALVLGILAVIGLDPLTLVLVGLLALGAASLFSGAAFGAKSLSWVQR